MDEVENYNFYLIIYPPYTVFSKKKVENFATESLK